MKKQVLGIAMVLLIANGVFAADETGNVKQQLLDLTGGHRVKVTWNQGADKEMKLKVFDTKDGEIRDVPIGHSATAPLLTYDGRLIVASTGKAPDREILVYDTESKTLTKVASGPGNNPMAVWQDPKTKRNWIYVNNCGDKNEAWNVPAGKVYRFPIDKPEAREMFWERTSSHIFLMFSADGTRACLEPNWGNIGQLKLAYDAEGKVDHDKSTYKQLVSGCFPSMAPDNSYRLFSLEGDHHTITLCDADGANRRKVKVSEMPGVREKGRNVWLTRWSTDPRYLTLIAPAGKDARIWMGRFDENFTKIEAWVPVSAEKGPQCWQSQAWIEP